MALDGYNWQGQCMTGDQLSVFMTGQNIGVGVVSSCGQPTANWQGQFVMECTYPNETAPINNITIPVSSCDLNNLNPGDLGVTVEITGAVLLLALGFIAGLLS